MAKLDSTIDALRTAERELRKSISAEAKDADSDRISVLVGWLKDLQRILREAEAHGSGGAERTSASSGEPAEARKAERRSGSASKVRYPNFRREGDLLVKIGWSKKSKAEYEHKAPRGVVVALADRLAEAGPNGRRFTMEQVLPLNDPATGQPFPDYQVYLSLAWLRETGAVVQEGRSGYQIPKKTVIRDEANSHWQRLSPGYTSNPEERL